MHIYMHTFHYFMFSWGYCKFYVIFEWNWFSRPLWEGNGVNGVTGPHPMKLGPNKDGNQMPHLSSILLTFIHLLQSSFTFWKTYVRGRWNVFIVSWRLFQIVHIYMHKAVKGFLHLTLWPLYHFFFQMTCQHIMHIYICTVQKRLSACYAYIHAHFSLFYVFMGLLQVLCDISMKWAF